MASEHSTLDNQRLSSEEELTIDHLAHLQEILHEVAPKCYDFGLQLGAEDHEIQVIRTQYPNLHDQLREILRIRLKQLPLLTWKDIIRALQTKTVGMNHLASIIQPQYRYINQSMFVQRSMSASPQVTRTQQPTPSPLLTHYSTSQSTLQPIPPTLSAHLQPLPQPYFPVGSRSFQAAHPHYLQTDASSTPPPDPPTSTPSQPQAEAAQPPSSSQPSSSQLMSVPVTSQAMSGPSPQLSQDVTTPHPLQVGEQQALQGQPPLQHIPSYQPQTVAQLHGTGSQGLLSQQTPKPAATSFPDLPQATHLPLHRLQPTPSLQQVARLLVTTPTSTAVQQSTAQQDFHPHIPWQPQAGGGTPTPHTYSVTQWPPGPLQLSSQYPLPTDPLSSNQLNRRTVPPLTITTHNPPRSQTHNQPLSPYTASSFGQLMSMCSTGSAVTRPHPPPVLPYHFVQYVNQPPPNPQLSWGQGMASPHHPQAGQQDVQGQPQLQHISSHESYGASPASFPQAKKARYESVMAQYIDYIKSVYERSVLNKLTIVTWPPTPTKVYINLVCVDRTTHVSKEEFDECTRAMVRDGSVDAVLGKKTPIDLSDIAKDVPTSQRNKRRVILVEGAPGVGKSTLAWEFCRRWERGETAQQYKLVLLLRLRDKEVSEAQSLADLLYHPSKAVVQAVEDELIATLGANTLIILEGFDELPSTCQTQSSVFFRLINGTLLPRATVLVTSRPWATRDLHRECGDCIFQHIEILGFTSKQIEEYVTSVFMDEENVVNDKAKQKIEEVMSYIMSFPQIQSCMYIPLNSAIVVSVYQESKAGRCILPKTLTELYLALTQTILLRYLYKHPEYGQRRWMIQSLKDDLPPDVYSKLLAISKLAYSGICTDQEGSVQLIFTNLPPDFETLGLMQSVPQLYVAHGEDMSHNFLHLTIQEFLAALLISNMSPEIQLEVFWRHEREGRWRVVLRFLAGITKLANLLPEDLRGLLLFKPKEGRITACRRDVCPVTPDVVLSSEHVHWMFEAQRGDIVPLVLQETTVEFRGEEGLTPLDYYSLGYCIVHSHCQWVLTMEEYSEIGEEEVRMLVAGANTRHDTSARVVGLRGGQRDERYGGGHSPLSISPEALHTLFSGLEKVLHLQELRLVLPVECSGVQWPDLSGLRVLCLDINRERNWRLDTLLPRVLLDSFIIDSATYSDTTVVLEDCVAIGMLLSSSNCLKCLHFQGGPDMFVTIDPQGMETITKAMSENMYLPLRSVVMKCDCTFSDTAAHSLAQFIKNTATLHHLSLWFFTFSAHGLLELAQAIHHSSSLQERELECFRCTVDGDDEVTDCAQLLHHYPHMVDWLYWHHEDDVFNEDGGDGIQWSHITDRGAQTIATALHHNSTLKRLNLSNNSIGDAGSTALAQALHHNSTLRELYLSNSSIEDAGSTALAQALHHNSTLEELDLSDNSTGDAGSTALAQALHHNSTLRSLHLLNDSIGDAGSTALAEALHHNSTLEVLDLSNNDAIGKEGTHQLVQALTLNTSIICLSLPRSCEEYATQCPQYSEVKHRIRFH